MAPFSYLPLATLAVLLAFILSLGSAFSPRAAMTPSPTPRTTPTTKSSPLLATSSSSTDNSPSSFFDDLTQRYQLFQKSLSDGYTFKQSTAIAIAGEYDATQVQSKINEYIESAPCVMFTWEASPSCKQAIKYMDIAGASYKIVRLDNPWSEGNPIRAELGKMVGRSSVPAIFIGGKYVGGYDGGSPGILEMAFRGTLREKLKEAGALKSGEE